MVSTLSDSSLATSRSCRFNMAYDSCGGTGALQHLEQRREGTYSHKMHVPPAGGATFLELTSPRFYSGELFSRDRNKSQGNTTKSGAPLEKYR